MCACVHIHMDTHVHTQTHMVQVCTYIHTHTHTGRLSYIYTHKHTHAHVHTHKHTYGHAHTYMHRKTHAHSPSLYYCYVLVVCSIPLNGQVDCGSGLVNMAVEGDNCTFSCDPGYMLQGSVTSGTCENTGSWSGGLPFCVPLNCTDRVRGLRNDVMQSSSCISQYQSQCTISCDEGFYWR